MEYCLWVYRCVFWCKRSVQKYFTFDDNLGDSHVNVSDIPWLWIGVTTSDKELFSVTDEINESIKYGDTVDVVYLEEVTGITDGIEWKYLDPVELVEKVFPSGGFLIENDSMRAGNKKKPE